MLMVCTMWHAIYILHHNIFVCFPILSVISNIFIRPTEAKAVVFRHAPPVHATLPRRVPAALLGAPAVPGEELGELWRGR